MAALFSHSCSYFLARLLHHHPDSIPLKYRDPSTAKAGPADHPSSRTLEPDGPTTGIASAQNLFPSVVTICQVKTDSSLKVCIVEVGISNFKHRWDLTWDAMSNRGVDSRLQLELYLHVSAV